MDDIDQKLAYPGNNFPLVSFLFYWASRKYHFTPTKGIDCTHRLIAGEPKVIPEIISMITLEKYMELIVLTVCGIFVSLKISLDTRLNLRAWLLPFVSILTVLLLVAILFDPYVRDKIRERKIFPKRVVAWVDRWVQASQWLRNPRQVFPGVLLTILIWGVMWLNNLILFESLALPLVGPAAGLVLILVYIGLLPALMLGNLGPFNYFACLVLLHIGILHQQAFVAAVI